jgi:hypothetical protein
VQLCEVDRCLVLGMIIDITGSSGRPYVFVEETMQYFYEICCHKKQLVGHYKVIAVSINRLHKMDCSRIM